MADEPSSGTDKQSAEPPGPEMLKPQGEGNGSNSSESGDQAAANTPAEPKMALRPRRAIYRPSHKATFIGLAAVVLILVVNAGIIYFVIKKQSKPDTSQLAAQGQVTIDQGALSKLGVNRSAVGNQGVELTVYPDAKFNGKVKIGSDITVGGKLTLNSKFTANEASLAKLDAGDTSLNKLNVNGDATVSGLSLRKDMSVTGSSKLQGPVTVSQLLTAANINVSGNLSVGGSMSVNNFHASSIAVDSTLTIGGHVITRGLVPNAGPGPSLGSNGTISISGNDASGTIAVNIGVGGGGGVLANVAFRNQYTNIPHVVVTAVGPGMGSLYVTRSIGGFSVGVNGPLAAGTYAIDYIVQQ